MMRTSTAIVLLSLGVLPGLAVSQETNLNTLTQRSRENDNARDKETERRGKEICSMMDAAAREQALQKLNRELRGIRDFGPDPEMKCSTVPAPKKESSGVLSEDTKEKVSPKDWETFERACEAGTAQAVAMDLMEKYNFDSATCPGGDLRSE